MALSDPLGDLLARIRNGQKARKTTVVSPHSILRGNICDVLQREGFIPSYKVEELEGGKKQLLIDLKYADGQPVIKEIHRVSKPGRRVYTAITELKPFYNGLGISILSTSRGVLSDGEAREANVGGEVLCKVF